MTDNYYKEAFLIYIIDITGLNVVLSYYTIEEFEVLMIFPSIISSVSITVYSLSIAHGQVSVLTR